MCHEEGKHTLIEVRELGNGWQRVVRRQCFGTKCRLVLGSRSRLQHASLARLAPPHGLEVDASVDGGACVVERSGMGQRSDDAGGVGALGRVEGGEDPIGERVQLGLYRLHLERGGTSVSVQREARGSAEQLEGAEREKAVSGRASKAAPS